MPAKKDNNGKKKRRMKPGPKTSKKKPVKVWLPAIIPGQEHKEEEQPTEHELSYEDALLAVKMEKLAAKGLTNDEIIKALPLSRATFYERLKEDPYFSYCLMKHRGKAVADVENKLFQNATGFTYMEQTATASGKVVTILKQKLPETKAQQFYLTNRSPEQWKNKVETVHEIGQGMAAVTFSIKRYEE
jgi:hypothetical protein